MAESIITDWLADYENLEPSELRSFVAQHEINHEVSSALFTILNERQKYPDLLHPVCNQFYSFYKSNEIELRRFTLQFIPILIYIYLNSVSQGDKKSCRSIETLLISIYNIEVSNDDGTPKIVSFRMPFLAQASIYHEEKNLHTTDLKRWEDNSNKEVKWGPLPQVESINAQNRLKVLTAILFNYNQQLSLINKSALYHLCRVSSQIVNQGFSKLGHAHRSSYGTDPNASSASISKPLPRIPVAPKLLLELLNASYFAMFNEFASVAIQAVDDIHNRACFEMYSDVILVTNAVKNSLHANPSGQPSDGPMGISVALTPATTTVTVSKSMITNASFRTKKLPDDIPIQGPKDDSTNTGQLVSITEESESDLGNRGAPVRSSKENTKSHKVPFPGFAKKLTKDKDKDKEKDKKSSSASENNLSSNSKNNGTANSNNTSQQMNAIPITTNEVLKRPVGKDKFASRNSLQMIIQGSNDFIETEKITSIKQKSNSIDTSIGLAPELNMITSNGGSGGGDEKILTTAGADSFNNSVDTTTDSIDSSIDVSAEPTGRPSIEIKSHTTIQVSQV